MTTTASVPILTPPKQTPPLVLVIFGASGDLTSRKILPALANLADRGRLNENFTVIGVARTEWTDEEFRKVALQDVPAAGEAWQRAGRAVPLHRRRVRAPRDLRPAEGPARPRPTPQYGTAGNRVYYLATIPGLFAMVAEALAKEGCNVPGPEGDVRPAGGREALRPGPAERPRPRPRRCTRPSTRTRSSGSTTTWAKRRSRTSWPCASPTPSSSRSGTAATSSRSRSRWPRASGSSTGAASTRRPGPCATSSRTTSCRCWPSP